MAFTMPSPQTWTLRLKAHKTTILLHTDPLHTFTTIKQHLYTALQETDLKDSKTLETIPLPRSAEEIQLGRPVNPSEPRLGFRLGEWEYPPLEDDEGDGEGDVKGKGKAKQGRPKKSDVANAVKDCPKGAGLRDGAVLSFRWPGDENAWDDDDDLDMEERDVKGVGGKKADMWGVKLASFEDSYGVENEIDVGGGREFEG